jgi:hypothetical protein
MKMTFMTMAAISALSVAAPASAAPWSGNRSDTSELRVAIEAGISSGAISANEASPLRDSLRRLVALEERFSVRGFSGRENATLRQRSALLRQQINRAERTDVRRDRQAAAADHRDRRAAADRRRDAAADDRRASRTASQERRDRRAAADDRRRMAADERREHRTASAERRDVVARTALQTRFDGPTPGDRFAGDVRVGQLASLRMIALPDRYRDEFRDTDEFYYRYDAERIYRLDRKTNLIVGLLDTVS